MTGCRHFSGAGQAPRVELIKLLVGSLAVLILPGFCLTYGLRKSLGLEDPVESVLLAVIGSYAWLLLVRTGMALLHLNLTAVGWVWWLFLLPLVKLRWKGAGLTPGWPFLACILGVFALGWNLEPALGGKRCWN